MKHILTFLSALKENNNKDWFNQHRDQYEEARKSLKAFTEMLINEIRTFDPEIPLLDPKLCMFRIFRDVRFSKDKSPYKTNFGSFIAPEGRKSFKAGYYLHLEPDNCFIGGGYYMPGSEQLKAIRDAIYETPEEYLEIIESEDFKNTFGDVWGDELKSYPRGYNKDWEYINLIKKKSYVGMHPVSCNKTSDSDFLTYTINVYRTLYPLNRFINDAIRQIG